VKYIFIINPIAGNDDKQKIFSRIKSAFRQIDDEMIIEETHAQGDAKDIAKRYSQQYGSDCVIVSCGGDGTVHEIANGLAGTDTPMMILPLGTGNDFAKKVYGNKKINVENVIKSFGFYNGKLSYEVKPIDLIDYNGEKCINVMSYGLDTKVETIGRQIAGKVPFLGHQAYNIAVLPVLTKPLHYSIAYDIVCYDKETNEEYRMSSDDKDYALFAICNASYYGGGYCPAPNSVLDDGLLDFVLLDGLSLVKAIPLIPKYSDGILTEKDSPKIHMGYMKSGRIWSTDSNALLGNCDGENFDYTEVNFKVEQKSLKLCFIKD
jgi:YegS/Rv2252/BmrU family lipid kinase